MRASSLEVKKMFAVITKEFDVIEGLRNGKIKEQTTVTRSVVECVARISACTRNVDKPTEFS